jgi:predicted dienelactone hydrolase
MRAALLSTLLAACAPPDEGDAPPPPDPVEALAAPGPYRAGYVETELTYTHPISGPRTMRLAVWYPTTATEGGEVRYQGAFPAPGVLDAPPIADGPFPLAVFSHGHQGLAESAGQLMAHLVTHGFLAVAPEHTGNTSFDFDPRQTAIYAERPADVSAVLDAVDDDAIAAIAGHHDGRTLGLGHSFGGFTALLLAGAKIQVDTWDAACTSGSDDTICNGWSPAWADALRADLADDRLSGVALLAPGDWRLMEAAGVGAVQIPALHLTGQLDPLTAGGGEDIWAHLPAPAWRNDLAHGGHQAWTDYAGFAPPIDSSPDVLAADRSIRVGKIVTLAFAQHVVLGQPASGVLDGSLPIDDDATAMVHAP